MNPLIALSISINDYLILLRSLLNFSISCKSTVVRDGRRPAALTVKISLSPSFLSKISGNKFKKYFDYSNTI
jgi:hypothetical protein